MKTYNGIKTSTMELFNGMVGLFMGKVEDYGTRDIEVMGQAGLTTRLFEKLERLRNLEETGRDAKNESILDTLKDIIGYCIIKILFATGSWVEDVVSPEMAALPDHSKEVQIMRSAKAKMFELPFPKKEGDVGYDLYTVEDTVIPANSEVPTNVPTGVRIKLPKGYFAFIVGRSSTARKLGIDVHTSTIDNGFTGDLYAMCYNRTGVPINIEAGTRLAQFILLPVSVFQVVEVDKLPETDRGESGFGSTGK